MRVLRGVLNCGGWLVVLVGRCDEDLRVGVSGDRLFAVGEEIHMEAGCVECPGVWSTTVGEGGQR